MGKVVVEGGYRLKGEVRVSGSKNAALPILISSLLADGESTFSNVPKLNDVTNVILLLENLGVVIERNFNVIKINSSNLNNYIAPLELMNKMRASILVLGPLVARLGRARVFLPGGCSIGIRPVNLHIVALRQLGVNIRLKKYYIDAFVKNKLKCADIYFDIVTVTGTENLIMAAVLVKGITILRNAACEPEIVALSNVLNNMGARISGAGTPEITIVGVNKLYPIMCSIVPDRIEVGTFMVASALTGGDISIIDCMPDNFTSITHRLRSIGAIVNIKGNNIHVKGTNEIYNIDLRTMPYPGFPTDMQAFFIVLMSISNGISVVSENIFENRFLHVNQLNKLGADIRVVNNIAVIRGVNSLIGTEVVGGDLRASASLILAGLVASGKTYVSGINHLDRGYEKFEQKIKCLGGCIWRECNE